MKESSSHSESDVRAMVRLLGEVAAIQGDHAEKKRFVMNGLTDLIGADCWIWCLVADPTLDVPPTLVNFTHGGFTEERFARFLEASQHPGCARYTAPILKDIQETGAHQTRLRQQFIPTPDFLVSEVFQSWSDANIGPILLSVRPIEEGCRSAIGLYRDRERELFTARESRIAHIILSEIPWLHEMGWPQDRAVTVPKLSPRQRLTLNLLLEGHGRKQIADHLGISEHTLSGYIKDVYLHFGVHSQSELMRRFLHGDGGDQPRASR